MGLAYIFCDFRSGNEKWKFAEIRVDTLSRMAAWSLDFVISISNRELFPMLLSGMLLPG